jgi:hypothetical protein
VLAAGGCALGVVGFALTADGFALGAAQAGPQAQAQVGPQAHAGPHAHAWPQAQARRQLASQGRVAWPSLQLGPQQQGGSQGQAVQVHDMAAAWRGGFAYCGARTRRGHAARLCAPTLSVPPARSAR